MPFYRVVIDAEMVVKATARDVVANRLRRMFREAQFDDKNVEWSLQHIMPKEAEALANLQKGGIEPSKPTASRTASPKSGGKAKPRPPRKPAKRPAGR